MAIQNVITTCICFCIKGTRLITVTPLTVVSSLYSKSQMINASRYVDIFADWLNTSTTYSSSLKKAYHLIKYKLAL